MPKRYTETEKWNDKWFRALKPLEKLIFNFMCDRCDLAGFYQIDLEDMEFRIKAPSEDILGAVQGLNRGLIFPNGMNDGSIIWIKNFLKHQRNLPLNPTNNAHRHIIEIISRHKNFQTDILNFLGADKGLISSLGNVMYSKGNVRGDSKGGNQKEKCENQLRRNGYNEQAIEAIFKECNNDVVIIGQKYL